MKTILFSMLGLACFAVAAASVEGSTILTADGSSLNVTSVPGPGAVGYIFFTPNGGSDLNALPGFASVATTGDARYSDNSYSTLTIAGTPYHTGVVYQGGTPSGTLATITLGSGVPSNFVLGLLANSTSDGPSNNTAYTVTDNLDLATVTVNSPKPASTVNQDDFFYIDVQGATAGEILTIAGNATQITLGGITFDTPEPAPIVALVGLCGMGLIGLVIRRRRRRNNS